MVKVLALVTGVYPNAVVTSEELNVIAPVLVLKLVTPPWYWGILITPVVLS